MSLALVIGLGARLVLYKLSGESGGNALTERLVAGLWQGASVHLALSKAPRLALGVILGIAARVLFALLQIYVNGSEDPLSLAASLLGVAFGVLAADVADALVGRFIFSPSSSKTSRPKLRRRVSIAVPPRSSVGGGISESVGNGHASHAATTTTPHTSRPSSPSPIGIAALERELADLQAKASDAASQKARFAEERAWALDARNFAWASQLAWQIQRCDVLERSYASAARQKMRELENQNFAVHVDVFGRSYLDDVLVHIEDRLVEARTLGKSRLRVALSGPRDQVDNEIKPLVKTHFKGMNRHVLQDPVDPTILYIDVDRWETGEGSSASDPAVRSDDWSRALD
ncbi:hypothetical protein BKA62DRAFT_5183 [Auriculariales sp. MPI-PUGE-AT-0066]|nr:hypothetical protein BKA62DRAFT_5183 [Auriculariales sp. MPI-PUGE-AT-0066]